MIWRPTSIKELMRIADQCTDAEEAVRYVRDKYGGVRRPQPGLKEGPSKGKAKKRPFKKNGKKKPQDSEVMAGFNQLSGPPQNREQHPARDGRRQPCPKKDDPEKNEETWCVIHNTSDHSLLQCRFFKKHVQLAVDKAQGKQVANQDHDSNDDFEGANDSYPEEFQEGERSIEHLFGGSVSYESNRQYQSVTREVLATAPVA